MTDTPGDITLARLIGSLDDDTALVAAIALESLWSDRHSCESQDCWGFRGYPADWFRRMLEAAIKAVDTERPRFIDLGAGIGTKCLFAKRMGCEAWGIEHNGHYVAAARRFGADVAEGDVRDTVYSRFDIVFVNCPFRDPAQQTPFEAKVAEQMRPGSVLILGNRAGPAPQGWEQLTTVIERDGAWLKPYPGRM
jgi:SAM-dependent methyltransferase